VSIEFASVPDEPRFAQTQVLAKSVKDYRSIEISFPVPDQSPLFASKVRMGVRAYCSRSVFTPHSPLAISATLSDTRAKVPSFRT
jgi:hypothetical protein